jgi:light-regulated signal transduction histidine kinase (bacteriophytochrome)
MIEKLAQQKAEELVDANTELMHRNEELDAFAYIASHDLKEPLRGAQAYAQFLLDDYDSILPEEGKRKARTLVQLSKRMEELINALSHYAHVGRIELESQSLSLEAIVASAMQMVQLLVVDAGARVRIAQSPLPTVRGNLAMIREIFTNLIANGIKYNDKPTKTIEIGVLGEKQVRSGPGRESRYVVVYIKDNGIGIAPNYQQNVFDIFRRLHSRDQYGGGTGVGLTITKKIIERHGGSIWLESQLGVGTTFFFTLPSVS